MSDIAGDTARDAETRLRDLKDRLARAARERIRAEHALDAATARAGEARTALLRDFGVSTVDQARVLLAELDQNLADDLDALDRALTQIGA